MTPEQRHKILELWTVEQNTAAAIAAAVNVSRSAVLGLVHRARIAGDARAVSRGPGAADARRNRLRRELARAEARAVVLRQALEASA